MIDCKKWLKYSTKYKLQISLLFLELFLLLILSELFLLWVLSKQWFFLSFGTFSRGKICCIKGDGRLVISLVFYSSGIGGATVPDTPSPRPCGTQKVPWRVYKSRNPITHTSLGSGTQERCVLFIRNSRVSVRQFGSKRFQSVGSIWRDKHNL